MTDATLIKDLKTRRLFKTCTDEAGLAARLSEAEPVTVYNGCDPTADSLHVGNLLGLLVLRRFQDAGHRPLALVGGATGMIGDPSGRSEERNLLDENTLAHNVAAIKGQISRILDLSGGRTGGALVDNRDWTDGVSFLSFLRDVGKHVTVGTMLRRDSVKTRMRSEHGISYTEFSYMLIQANDFLHLEQTYGCQLQVGGSDQLGNMIGGIDLIRRVRKRPAWAFAWPLLTAPDGTKLGKSTGARIWLDPKKTSPYEFFQHWMHTDDAQVRRVLLQFTLLPVAAVNEVMREHRAAPEHRWAQQCLAVEATGLVHGAEAAKAAHMRSILEFRLTRAGNPDDIARSIREADDDDASLVVLEFLAANEDVLQLSRADLEGGLDLAEVLTMRAELASSKSDARRLLEQGGIYVNGSKAEPGRRLTTGDLLHGRFVRLRRGKRVHVLAEVSRF